MANSTPPENVKDSLPSPKYFQTGRSLVSGYAPLYVMAVLFLFSGLLWHILLQREANLQRQVTAVALKDSKIEIIEKLDQYAMSMQRMANRLEYLGLQDKKFIALDAKNHLLGLRGLKRLGLTDTHLQVIWSYPDFISSQVKNFNQGFNPKRKQAFDQALNEHHPALSDDVNLNSGGQGFIMPVPLFSRDEHPIGFLYGSIDAQKFFEQIVTLSGYKATIASGDVTIYDNDQPTNEESAQSTSSEEVKWGLVTLRVTLVPTIENLKAHKGIFPEIMFAVSLLFSVLAGLLLRVFLVSQKAQQALLQSQERFNFIAGGTNEGIFEVNLENGELYVSTIGKRILEMPTEATPKLKDWSSRIHPDDRERVITARSEYLAKKIPIYDVDYRFRSNAAEGFKWLNAHGHAEWNDDGKPLKLAGSVREITDKKKVQEELGELNKFNNAIFESSPTGITIFEASGKCLRANVAASKLSGATLSQILNSDFTKLQGWKSSGFLNVANQALATGRNTYFEGEIKTITGKKVFVLATFVPLNISGKALLMVQVQDISELKRAHETESLYRSALDQSAAVFFTDPEGYITHTNELACTMSGYSGEELLGQKLAMLRSGYHKDEFFIDLWNTIGTGRPWHGEICNRSKTGQLYWVNTTIVSQVDKSGAVGQHISVQLDITHEKNAEMKLLSSSKMSSLGEMAAGIAHEINNPLAIILGSSDRLRRVIEMPNIDTAKIKSYADTISNTVNRIAKIVEGLRVFARDGQSDPFADIKVTDLIDSALDICRNRFENSGIPIRVMAFNADLTVQCQQVQLCQVLLNLLNNSFDAINGTKNPFVEIQVQPIEQNWIEIAVVDSGRGIPSELAAKIMQPFYTTKEVGKGTGLGLSISSGIAQSHQGELFLDSTSKNTRFVLRVPAKQTQRQMTA